MGVFDPEFLPPCQATLSFYLAVSRLRTFSGFRVCLEACESNDETTFPACGALWRGEGGPKPNACLWEHVFSHVQCASPKCLNETAHWLSIPSIPMYSLSCCCSCLSCIHKAASRTDLLIKEMNSSIPPSKKKPLLGDRSNPFSKSQPRRFFLQRSL